MAKISDIAKKLNLSNATVSKALNGSLSKMRLARWVMFHLVLLER